MPKDATALEIHFCNVSQGDSILIINRDLDAVKDLINKDKKLTLPTDSIDWMPYAIENDLDLAGTVKKALLIDGGEDYYGGDVFAYMKTYGVSGKTTQANFMTATSHYHSDHTDGLRSVYKKKKSATNSTLVNNYPPAIAYDMGDDDDLDPGTWTFINYKADIEGFQTKALTTRTTLAPRDTIDLGTDANGTPILLRCMAANGVVTKDLNNTTDIINRKLTVDQNDRSLVLVLEYGEFRCMFGGDAGGNGQAGGGNLGNNADQRTKQYWSSHGDLETPLRPALYYNYPEDPKRAKTSTGHICCFKAHHHGSASSNDVFLLVAMEPALVFCSSGTRVKFHGHATQEALNRIDSTAGGTYSPQWTAPKGTTFNNSILAYYITELAEDGRYGWGGKKNQQFTRTYPKGKILGDIIMRPFGDVRVQNKNGNNPISIQVYGTGAQAALDGDKDLEPIDSSKTGVANYPVGPWEHTCDKH